MSISSIFGSPMLFLPKLTPNKPPNSQIQPPQIGTGYGGGGGLLIEPRKSQLWDVRRKLTVYHPLSPLPPD
ncbi:hypothetical protein P3X46_002407 [Hevea brasiliensis]|uniref:Uncharacterized protein n=1 Tax=Hevea brasiliensis TaxID=3981 RepID=A0ABQ9N3N9_HEVBR|nr:hypothetical protein P3X46_002407 [Hevea brasiliensis]